MRCPWKTEWEVERGKTKKRRKRKEEEGTGRGEEEEGGKRGKDRAEGRGKGRKAKWAQESPVLRSPYPYPAAGGAFPEWPVLRGMGLGAPREVGP